MKKPNDYKTARNWALTALFLSLVCLGMLIAYLTMGNVLAAAGCLIAFGVFVTLAARWSKGSG